MSKVVTKKELTAAERVTKCFVWMMRDKDFMSVYPTAMVGNTAVIEDAKNFPSAMQTAYTDGANVRFFQAFVDKLTDPELRFVLLHENYHKMYRHIANYESQFRQNPMLVNAAMDFRVNADIQGCNNAGVKMPSECLYDAKYADPAKWDVTRIMKDLRDNGFPQQQQCNGQCQGGDGQQGQQGQQGKGQPNGRCTCPQGFDAHGWEEGTSLTPEEQRQLAQDIDQAIRQGQRLAGAMGGNQNRSIGELTKVRMDYKAALREFMKMHTRGADETSWARPNRRYIGNDEYMPSAISESMGEMFIGIDTSGSIGQEELTFFLSNVAVITQTIKPIRIHLGYWDTAIKTHETYDPHQYESIAKSTKPYGGGGTDPTCVVEYLKKHDLKPEVILMLSDGYLGRCPTDFPAPVLWAIIQNEGFTAPSPQKTIHLPEGWTED